MIELRDHAKAARQLAAFLHGKIQEMRLLNLAIIFLLFVTLCGCARQRAETRIDPELDACSVLPGELVGSTLGEKVVETKPSSGTQGGLMTKHCFYRVDNFSRSVDVEITATANGSERSDAAADFWNRRFHPASDPDDEEREERKTEHTSQTGGREEEEERSKPQPSPVSGLGDEAFWTTNQLNSALHVKHGNVLIRISLGGPDDPNVRLEHARSFAARILSSLK